MKRTVQVMATTRYAVLRLLACKRWSHAGQGPNAARAALRHSLHLVFAAIVLGWYALEAPARASSQRLFPELEVQDRSGAAVRFVPPQHGVVIVQTWASWCAPCHEAVPFLASLVRSAPEVRLVLLNADHDRSRALQSMPPLGEAAGQATLLFDPSGKALARLEAPGMPSTFVIVDGSVVLAQAGFDSSLAARIEKAVRDALAARSPQR